MDSSLLGQLLPLGIYTIVLMVLHELAHVAVARAHGYPVVCLALSPFAVGIVFLDQPHRRYWLYQVAVPMAVTAVVTYLGLFALAPASLATRVVLPQDALWPWGISWLLALLTSSGDILSMATEMRMPVTGQDRVVRDVRFLRKSRSLIRFTPFGLRYLRSAFGLSAAEFLGGILKPQPR